jgi:hypothetical protein
MIDAALKYRRKGFSVIPCDPKSKNPLIETWKPYQSRLPTEAEIDEWWSGYPAAAIGVVTGEISNLVVVDVDDAEPGTAKNAQERFGETPWRAKTPGGGVHLGYVHPGVRVANACRLSGFDFDMDIRGDGGYVLVPPSPGYTWETENPFAERPILRRQLLQKQRAETVPSDPEPIEHGRRNATLTSLGGTMRRRGMTREAIEAALLAENEKRCEPPLPKYEVRGIVTSVLMYSPPDSRLRLLTQEEFANDLAPEQIVEGMIYRSSTHLLTGASKGGKSWLAYQLGLAAQAGEPFLGLEVTSAKVLLISLEMNAGMIRKRMEGINRDVGLPVPDIPDRFNMIAPTSDYVPMLDLGSEAGIAELKSVITETGSDLVILDTLYRFIPGCDPISNADMGPVFGRLNDTAQSTGAALLMLDHVAKGEQLGPVAHSALGAQVKGGASRVIIALQRISRGDGLCWQLDVDSHFGSWDEPMYYKRPKLADGGWGEGCVPCGAKKALNLSAEGLRRLFETSGVPSDDGRLCFPSKRKLTEALISAGLASGNQDASGRIGAIMREFCAPEAAANRLPERPVVTSKGPRNAVIFTWRGAGSSEGPER